MPRLYGLLLRLLPRARRESYGEMAAVFADQHSTTRRRAGLGALGVLWMKETTGMLRFSWSARRSGSVGASGRRRSSGAFGGPGLPTELRWARRNLRARGTRALFVVGLLALAMAANTTVFSAADSFVFRPLPYPDAGRLATFMSSSPISGDVDYISRDMLIEWRRHTDLFRGGQAHARSGSAYLTINGVTEPIRSHSVTPGMFELLGVGPLWGRPFVMTDVDVGTTPVVVISEALARRLFANPADAVGQEIRPEGEVLTVVGVMPDGFRFPTADEQIWRPLDLARWSPISNVRTVVRLAEWVDFGSAALAVQDRLPAARAAAGDQGNRAVRLVPLVSALQLARAARLLAVLLGAALCLLLIACANVASLELAGATLRARTFAVQTALGATRWTLIRSVMVEGAALIGLTVLVATALASAATSALANTMPMTMRSALANPIDLDSRALVFMSVVAAAVWALTSLPIAWRASRGNVVETLKSDQRTMPVSAGDARIRQVLMAGQVALTVVLLVGALLYGRTYSAQLGLDKGFDSANLVSVEVFPPRGSSIDSATLEAELLDRLRVHSGVVSISRTSEIPPTTGAGIGGPLTLDELPAPVGDAMAAFYSVDPSYFETLRLPLLAGPGLARDDLPGKVVVDEAFVARFFPSGSPIGRRFSFGSTSWDSATEHQIVGVARHVHSDVSETLSGDPVFVVYVPFRPESYALSFVVRLDDLSHMAGLTQMVRDLATTCVVRTDVIDDRYARLYGDTALAVSVAGGFGAMAFLVATAGVYGVMAFLVAGRRREIGIRLALGADQPDIQRLVFGVSLRYVALGVAVGLVGAASVGRLVESQLFGVAVTDPFTYTLVAVSTLAAALLATWHPARQAARVDPAVTLKAE